MFSQRARALSWSSRFSLLKRGSAQEFAVAFERVLPGRVGPVGFSRKGLNVKPERGIQAS